MADNNNNNKTTKTPKRFRRIMCAVRGGRVPGSDAAQLAIAESILERLKLQQCPDCHETFPISDREEIYVHWEGEHREYAEQENPLPSPSAL